MFPQVIGGKSLQNGCKKISASHHFSKEPPFCDSPTLVLKAYVGGKFLLVDAV